MNTKAKDCDNCLGGGWMVTVAGVYMGNRHKCTVCKGTGKVAQVNASEQPRHQ